MLNVAKGNMYGFLNEDGKGYTWNLIKGKCPHNCAYCYMKRFPQKEIRFDTRELKVNLYPKGVKGNFIFIGSSCDMWAETIPAEWITKILDYCCEYPENKYLFQSKNPKRFLEYYNLFPDKTILAITLETNRDDNKFTGGQIPSERIISFGQFDKEGVKKTVTIEPIMAFDVLEMARLLKISYPNWVSIGADSGNNNLPEPSKEDVCDLIRELEIANIKIKQKSNLARLFIGKEFYERQANRRMEGNICFLGEKWS